MDRGILLPRYPVSAQPERWGEDLHPPLHEPITEKEEGNLVRRVLADRHYRHAMFNVKGLEFDGATALPEVPLRTLRSNLTGDVDILLIPAEHPERATAIQVKRFKVDLEQLSEDDEARRFDVLAGRMQRLFIEGVKQANIDAAVGFGQVYLWVFVVVDSRRRSAGRFTYDGEPPALSSRISQIVSTSGLSPRVGLMKFEWTQAIDQPPFEIGTHGGHLVRLADSFEQPAEVTEWVKARANVGPSSPK